MDGYGHGTHVAGTLGAVGNNGIGVAGVVWTGQIVPVKFFDNSGNGTVSQFIDGLDWALSKGIKISNNSWTDSGYTPALFEAVRQAHDAGHLFVAAAGNNGRDSDQQPAYPADFALNNVVSVGATDRYDRLAGFSNYGAKSLAIVAPGVDIYSTTVGGGYGIKSGTSMAAPHVAGTAALVWSLHPNWTYQQVIDRLLATADKLPSLAGKVRSGRLNSAAAVGALAPQPPAASPTAPALRIVDSVAGPSASQFTKVTVRFDRPPVASTFTPADVVLSGPDGVAIAVASVTPVSGSSILYDLNFATQTRPGYYKLQVGPDVTAPDGGRLTVFNSSLYLKGDPNAPPPPVTPPPPTAPALRIVDSVAGPTASQFTKVTVRFDRPPVASTFTPADVVLSGPDGVAIAVASVTPVSGSSILYDLNFATQTRPGYYKLQVGPDVTAPDGGRLTVFNSSLYLKGDPNRAAATGDAAAADGAGVADRRFGGGTERESVHEGDGAFRPAAGGFDLYAGGCRAERPRRRGHRGRLGDAGVG